MNCSSLDPELTAKVLLLASLQRSLAGSDLHHANSTAELHCKPTLAGGEQLRAMHPLLMPSLVGTDRSRCWTHSSRRRVFRRRRSPLC